MWIDWIEEEETHTEAREWKRANSWRGRASFVRNAGKRDGTLGNLGNDSLNGKGANLGCDRKARHTRGYTHDSHDSQTFTKHWHKNITWTYEKNLWKCGDSASRFSFTFRPTAAPEGMEWLSVWQWTILIQCSDSFKKTELFTKKTRLKDSDWFVHRLLKKQNNNNNKIVCDPNTADSFTSFEKTESFMNDSWT